jgi:phosphomethylpyrimidine synthase
MLQERNRTPGEPGESVTQLRYACAGRVTVEMRRVAERENEEPETIRDEVARGRMIIPANVHHAALDAMCIGKNSRVKINSNIGNSQTTSDI